MAVAMEVEILVDLVALLLLKIAITVAVCWAMMHALKWLIDKFPPGGP